MTLTRPDHPIVRNSSFELLRIVGMLMIVASHTGHGGFNFPVDSITLNRLYLQFIAMGGALGNDIFVMLSGYFLINSKGLNFRRLFNLWTRIFFYSVIIYCMFLFSGLEVFSLKTAIKVIMPITQKQWWFASAYFMLYLIHPYINRLLHSFTREEYMKFLLFYWFISPIMRRAGFESGAAADFLCLYSIAGYARLYAEDFGKKDYILLGLAFIGVNFLSVIIFDVIGMKYSFFAHHSGYFTGMTKPFTILAVLCLLIGFQRLNIPHSKVINTIASATFGVHLLHSNELYLVHSNMHIYNYVWREIFRVASFQNSPYLIPYSIACIMAVYVSCTILELIRSKIFRTLTRGYLS